MADFIFLYRNTEADAREFMGTPQAAQESMKHWMVWLQELETKGHLKSRGEPLERTPGSPPVTYADNAPTLQALGECLDDSVKRALDRVPEVYRVPFYLAVIEDLTCAEIARRLAVPEGTVMSRIHRARERLKRDLVYDRRASSAAAAQPTPIGSKLRVVRGRNARTRVAS